MNWLVTTEFEFKIWDCSASRQLRRIELEKLLRAFESVFPIKYRYENRTTTRPASNPSVAKIEPKRTSPNMPRMLPGFP